MERHSRKQLDKITYTKRMVVKLFLPFDIDEIQCHFSKQYVELQGTLKGLEFKAVLTYTKHCCTSLYISYEA